MNTRRLPSPFNLQSQAGPLRYIQIGTGGFGAHWCRNVLPRLADLGQAVAVAAVDINPAHWAPAREHLRLPAEKCYGDLRTALAENTADFAVIVIPPACHEEAVDLCLQHGLHILSEKPIADTMAACCRIQRKVAASGRKMAVTMTHRFDQDKQSLAALIHSGDYGRLDYLTGYTTWAWRAFPQWGAFRYRIPDPLLVESTVHQFDIMRALAGANARTVYARTWNPPWSEFQGHAQGLFILEMENGVHIAYESAKANATELTAAGHWRAECDRATLELDHRRLRVIRGNLHQDPVIEEKPLLEQAVWTNEWLAEMFCDWLQGRRDDHPTALADNLQCAALLFAAIESAHSGRPVEVQEFLQRHLRASC
ncbi:MAG TPA: Gfo/Idh/MocA family oxidoreductase [Lacunisphaera sp.]|nr:Gfo/Idh/MocA family oxidoreductase [Lacunisphaera sp.]